MAVATVADWGRADEEGRTWISPFRKVPASTATVTGQWFDYSTAAGGPPVPNYYASSPLVAATLDPLDGIFVPAQSGKRWLKSSLVMSAAASVTGTTNRSQALLLLDYALYYPFIDLDAAGDVQLFDNDVALPRYDGVGVEMMLVAQAPTVGGGQFSVTYEDADGVERTTPTLFCAAAQPSGALVNAVGAAAGVLPFLPRLGRGVRKVNSITMSVANGGLAALVLVKPIAAHYAREECRRPTSSPTESFGDADLVQRVRQRPGTVEIKAGAFLGWIGCGAAGSLASAPLVGIIETAWEA